MANKDPPTDEEVAAACKEGHPVTTVTMGVYAGSLRVAAGVEATCVGPADTCGPDL